MYIILTTALACYFMSVLTPISPSFSSVYACDYYCRPAHIYDNVGRYDDCITASELAITSDRAYLASCFTPAYDIHNQDILVACAVMGGRLRDALTYAVPAGALLLEATAASAMGTTAMRPYHYTLATVCSVHALYVNLTPLKPYAMYMWCHVVHIIY